MSRVRGGALRRATPQLTPPLDATLLLAAVAWLCRLAAHLPPTTDFTWEKVKKLELA
jgi:hypothetical protein